MFTSTKKLAKNKLQTITKVLVAKLPYKPYTSSALAWSIKSQIQFWIYHCQFYIYVDMFSSTYLSFKMKFFLSFLQNKIMLLLRTLLVLVRITSILYTATTVCYCYIYLWQRPEFSASVVNRLFHSLNDFLFISTLRLTVAHNAS